MARDLASLHQSDPWVAVAAGALLVVVGTVELYLRNARRTGWGLALLGLVVLAVLAERLVIAVTPKVSAAALTFRSLMPIVPLFALVAGGGLWAAAGALALLIPSARSARAGVAVLIAAWSWSSSGRRCCASGCRASRLLGRVADRGADPDTPQGLRVEAMVAGPGLAAGQPAARRPDPDRLIPRQLAWYADLGVDGLGQSDRPRLAAGAPRSRRRQYILDRVGPRGVSTSSTSTSTGPIPAATRRASGARRTKPWPAGPISKRPT